MPLIEIDTLDILQVADGIRVRPVTAVSMTVAHVELDEGAILPEHAHVNEQVVNVIEGRLELTVAGEVTVLERGKVMILPPDVPHSGRALTDVYVVDVFHPVRADWADPDFAGYGTRD